MRRRSITTCAAALVLISVATLASGCGKKGPLYLPPPPSQLHHGTISATSPFVSAHGMVR
ncbi:MAG: LPS translocon maturation chaperone LptM [Sulfurifustis sp.]